MAWPDFKSGWGSEPVPGGFDPHSPPPARAGSSSAPACADVQGSLRLRYSIARLVPAAQLQKPLADAGYNRVARPPADAKSASGAGLVAQPLHGEIDLLSCWECHVNDDAILIRTEQLEGC